MNIKESALALAARGFPVFPLTPMVKAPPLISDWPSKATLDPDVINVLWDKWPKANVGIHCAGLVVIDVDVKKNGQNSLAFISMTEGLPQTLVSLTPTGGQHIIYRLPVDHPGVQNGVDVLGPGLDIRSTNGYIVAPGSLTELGKYRFEGDVAIADAPAWLIQKLGVFTKREHTPKTDVPDAAENTYDRAEQWLAKQAPAVEGSGGDLHTFTVVCGLRDIGVSAGQALDLLAEWNYNCAPPWTHAELATKVENAYRYAQNAPGERVASPSEFGATASKLTESVPAGQTVNVGPSGQTPGQVPTVAMRLGAFARDKRGGSGYLVKGLLDKGAHAVMFGAPGEGKTFMALDLAYHVSAGTEWMGHKVKQGAVLYLAFEGIGGLVKRAQALRRQYGDADVPFFIVDSAFNLRDLTGRQDLGAVVASLPERPALIIIDTLARALSMSGGDENSAQDMGSLNMAVGELIKATGATVMVIHHSGKNKSAGARGSSALLGAIDTELEVSGYTLKSTKQREVDEGDPIGFKLQTTIVGRDEDGDDITSCVVRPAKAVTAKRKLSGQKLQAFQVLEKISPNNDPVTKDDWKDACVEEFLHGGARPGKRFDQLRMALEGTHDVVEGAGGYTRKMV